MIPGLAQKLKAERKKAGLSQAQVAERTGINSAKLSKYETDRATPPTDAVRKLAAFYRVSTDYLLGLSSGSFVNAEGLTRKQIDKLQEFINELNHL